MTPTDAELELARQRWMRDFALLLRFRVDSNQEAAAWADAWCDANMSGTLNQSEGASIRRNLIVPVRSGSGDMKTLHLGSQRTFAEEAAKRSEVAGGVCYVGVLETASSMLLDFSIWPAPADPDEVSSDLDVTLTSPFWAFDGQTRERLLSIADGFASQGQFVYGQVGASQGSGPSLLRRHPAALGPYQAWQRDVQIGYDWVTYVRAELATKVKSERLQQASNRLFSVRTLQDGTLRLQATERAEDYNAEAACAVFDALVDVLPDGAPQPLPIPGFTPRRDWALLCHRDPREFR